MMSIHHRKLHPSESKCNYFDCTNSPHPPPPPPPPPLNRNYGSKQSHHFSPILIPMFCVLGSVFIALCYLIFIKRYYSNSNNSRRNPPPFEDDDREDDLVHENHGPVLDHPIWYINTVGLQQSIIDSIAVFKYKRNDEEQGLIEGTDCSVCLNEFQEDETLRLLPKCSHAFHLPCIDTWLRSHKNCPLCRAPIVCDSNLNDARSSPRPPPESNSNRLGPREEVWEENYDRLGSRSVGGGSRTIEPRDGADIAEVLRENSRCSDGKNRELRVLSDLADRRLRVEQNLFQPVRRSISLDGSSASRIYFSVSNISGMEFEGCSSTQPVRVKNVNSEKFAEKLNRNLGFSLLMKSSSMGRSLQNRPVSMKRSFSSSRKLSRRFSRSQDWISPFACR